MSMTAKEAIKYIENQGWNKTRLGLSRTRELAKRLGDPQKSLKFIHVAGTNGKGSTASMLESILRQAGYRTGLYTSPHLIRYNERIRVNGREIPDDALARITGKVAYVADRMPDHPSLFEILTCLAFLYFLEEKCDIVVLEVGMGGELDSTNIIDPPELAVITNIGLDHTQYLGNTVEKIAHEKAGIIKKGTRAVSYAFDSAALSVIKESCLEKKVPLKIADFSRLVKLSISLKGQDFSYKGEVYHLSLCASYEQRNAALVLEAIESLRLSGWQISTEAVKEGLASTTWPARFEVLSEEPLVILDGGHNVQCAEGLMESINELLPDYKLTFLMGMLKDKDYLGVIDRLVRRAERFITLMPDSTRALKSEELAECIRMKGKDAFPYDDIGEGIRAALSFLDKDKKKGLAHVALIMFGSLYLAGSLREYFKGC